MKPAQAKATQYLHFPLATALRISLRNYSQKDLIADLMAGMTVGMLAIPLAMALAIAIDVPPQHGLYTALIAGAVIALAGGSRFSVSGPTAAFIVLLIPIVHSYGLGGLLMATMLTGLILIGMGLLRLGQLIRYIPYPVVLGFTAGIGVVIAFLQIKDLLGLHTPEQMPAHFIERLEVLFAAIPSAQWPDALVGLMTLGLLLTWDRLNTPLPRYLAALILISMFAFGLHLVLPGFNPITVGDNFHWTMHGQSGNGIPPFLPPFAMPWDMPNAQGEAIGFSWTLLRDLLMPALTLAMLGAIESLLCAVVADGMTHTRHDPDAELVGQGIGNLLVPFFGGITATAAIARTAANIRSGAVSPLAAVFNALMVLLALVIFAPLLAHVPMATLAAMLLIVAWGLSEAPHFVRTLRVAPRTDVAILLACFGLTIFVDMVAAVGVGMVLAAFVFMHQMASLTAVERREDDENMPFKLPEWALFYEFHGPLFFGAAERAILTLEVAMREHDLKTVLILDFTHVPTIDMSGIHALETAFQHLNTQGIGIVLSGMHPAIYRHLRKAGLEDVQGRIMFSTDATQTALAAAELRQYQRDQEAH
ncbi:MAG: C4-dicarboxylic acid transporter DauA [Gammaproteobacteria bacterium 28-57-27]|nr:MAG: C4-dicarboxylic acid transporter DauA [Gammaproteobacteria bacterium 28-57-27]